MQEYANCFSNTGTQIPKLPPHPEGNGTLGFLNPLLNENLPVTKRCVQRGILRQFQGPAINFHLFADDRSRTQAPLSHPSL